MPFYKIVNPMGQMVFARRYQTREEAEARAKTINQKYHIVEEEDDQEVVDAVEQLIDTAMKPHCTGGEDPETFYECRACGEWDGHADNCPIPLLVLWLDPDDAHALGWKQRLMKNSD